MLAHFTWAYETGPPETDKALFFGNRYIFFGQLPAAKIEKKNFVFIKRKKWNPSVQ